MGRESESRPAVHRALGVGLLGAIVVVATACTEDDAATERKAIVQQHLPRVNELVEEDIERQKVGLQEAVSRLVPHLQKAEGATSSESLRELLKRMQQPPKGVGELITSPMSFLAVVGPEGTVVARDADPDRMQGKDFGKRYASVRSALAGKAAHELAKFEAGEGKKPSWSLLFAVPLQMEGQEPRALIAGIPLWRLAQKLSRQLRLEQAGEEQGAIVWVYLFKDGRLFHYGTPPELDKAVPDNAAREKAMAAQDEGRTGHVKLHGRTYGWGVGAVPGAGEDVGALVMRSDMD